MNEKKKNLEKLYEKCLKVLCLLTIVSVHTEVILQYQFMKNMLSHCLRTHGGYSKSDIVKAAQK